MKAYLPQRVTPRKSGTPLPAGKQWIAHCGSRQQTRLRRQREHREAKERKAAAGVEVGTDGRTPAGLIVPGFEPRE
jgi:hypothetical protein